MAHLHTLVGGRITTLRQMIQHYISLGVQTVSITIHLPLPHSDFVEEVHSAIENLNIGTPEVVIGPLRQIVQEIHKKARARYPRDWHIIADQDEFQMYPRPLFEVEDLCEKGGYDYVGGCFLDRLSADGMLQSYDPNTSIWDQFPIGAFLTYPLLRGYPRKVALMRSSVDLPIGQHFAESGRGCPIHVCSVQVHHFKWVNGLIEYLRYRSRTPNAAIAPNEGMRFIQYMTDHGNKVDLNDARILADKSDRDYYAYSHWMDIVKWMRLDDVLRALGECVKCGPAQLAAVRGEIVGVQSQLDALLPDLSS